MYKNLKKCFTEGIRCVKNIDKDGFFPFLEGRIV